MILLLAAGSGCALFGTVEVPEAPVFYPPLPQAPRIQFLATYTSEHDVTGGVSGFRRFILGEPSYRELGKPYGVALADGKLFVCDTRSNAVIIFDLRNRSIDLLGHVAPGRLSKPINVTVDEEGRRYVTDTKLRRVLVYDADNRYLRAYGDPEKWAPSDVAVTRRRLYAVDVKGGQVFVLDKESGEELRRFGKGMMFAPTNLDVDEKGNVYVADTGNARVIKFSPRGRVIQQFGSLGRGIGQFVRPKGVALDREERLYVVDAAFENVQVFDRKGRLLLFFGQAGNVSGGLNIPAKVTIDYENVDLFADRVAPGHSLEYLILVSSQFGLNKVNVYGFLADGKGED
jgi:DNA-binding beta-propeller fold protein YncE